MLALPCLDKGAFYNGSKGGAPIFVRFRRDIEYEFQHVLLLLMAAAMNSSGIALARTCAWSERLVLLITPVWTSQGRHRSAVIAEVNDELLPGYTNTVLTPRARANFISQMLTILSARLITRSIYATAKAEDGYGSLYLNTDGECPNALLKRELRWLAQQNPHFSAISDSGR